MIQKLRRQFIVVAMCSTLAVLTVIIGTLNVYNYNSTVSRKDEILEILSSNNGVFPETFDFRWDGREEPKGDVPPQPPAGGEFHQQWNKEFFGKDKKHSFSRETPYETRFFSAFVNQGGEVKSVDVGRIASVEGSEAGAYAQTALKKFLKSNQSKGFLDNYRYLVTENASGYLVVFVDCTTDLQTARKVLLSSISVAFLGTLAVLLLVLYFSKKVFRPVEISYRKQKQFITDASHELKTPLTIISANVEVMEMESEESQWSKSIKKQIDRMISLVEQMVTLSRLDEALETAQDKFSLSDAVRETAELYLPMAESKGKELQLEIAEGISLTGDEKKIRQMVGLLLDNAMKYASCPVGTDPAGGVSEKENERDKRARIQLSLKQKGKKAELILWNTTDQVEAGNQDVLFERFYRPDSSRNSAKGGSGIGLSIVKAIVEAHKGKITAVSKDGTSIEFKAILPNT